MWWTVLAFAVFRANPGLELTSWPLRSRLQTEAVSWAALPSFSLSSPMASLVFLVEFLTVVFERSMIPAFKCLEAFPSWCGWRCDTSGGSSRFRGDFGMDCLGHTSSQVLCRFFSYIRSHHQFIDLGKQSNHLFSYFLVTESRIKVQWVCPSSEGLKRRLLCFSSL